jgi:hypothetical protein
MLERFIFALAGVRPGISGFCPTGGIQTAQVAAVATDVDVPVLDHEAVFVSQQTGCGQCGAQAAPAAAVATCVLFIELLFYPSLGGGSAVSVRQQLG